MYGTTNRLTLTRTSQKMKNTLQDSSLKSWVNPKKKKKKKTRKRKENMGQSELKLV